MEKKEIKAMGNSKLVFAGNLVIGNIEKIKNNILKKVFDTEFSSIYFDNVAQIDLAGIQMLEALRKTMLKGGKECKIELNIVPEYETILKRAGFKYFIDQISFNTEETDANLCEVSIGN